jgi:hypothetical protein
MFSVFLHTAKKKKRILWPQSARELYRPSDRPMLAKIVPTFATMVSATDPYGRILCFLDQYIKKQVVKMQYENTAKLFIIFYDLYFKRILHEDIPQDKTITIAYSTSIFTVKDSVLSSFVKFHLLPCMHTHSDIFSSIVCYSLTKNFI